METKSNKTWIWLVVLLLAVTALGATTYALMNDTDEKEVVKEPATTSTVQSESSNDSESGAEATTDSAVIDFTDDGFSQQTYTFASGTAVTVNNKSSMDMQFSSDDHPSHRDHSELNMKLLGPGESGTFTPPGKGTYGFHDHINDQFEGTLIIQ